MAGVTDRPFRQLCRIHGAALTPSEMLSSDLSLWNSEKSRLRRQHDDEASPRVIQIAGSDPAFMAEAARLNVKHGAEIIDINMGCPAKKVLKRAAGSALLRDEKLVASILKAVVNAVDVPVSLKIRTGWNKENRNGLTIARIAEDCGISALAIHGRTRECAFKGEVEYDTIANIKANISIPVFANGDIRSPQQAKYVLQYTGADAVMIGRGAQGRPWIFNEIAHYLEHGKVLSPPSTTEIYTLILQHLQALHDFYGEFKGVMIARKHLAWYLQSFQGSREFRSRFNQLETAQKQKLALKGFFYQVERHETVKQEEEIAA